MSSAENEQVGGEGAMEDDDGIEDNIGMNLLQEQFTIETSQSSTFAHTILWIMRSRVGSQSQSMMLYASQISSALIF